MEQVTSMNEPEAATFVASTLMAMGSMMAMINSKIVLTGTEMAILMARR
jgi:hypothetical protein